MNLLRIFSSPLAAPAPCRWVRFQEQGVGQHGKGTLAQLPQGAARVELVLAASEVLLMRTQLPPASRRRSAAVLGYAAEDKLASDPDSNQVSRIGQAGADDVLAVVNRKYLKSWYDALDAAGIHVDAVYCETLLLPLRDDEWSLAWNGQDGHLRTGEFEGGATDCGDRMTPPLVLQLLLEDARVHAQLPASIAVHVSTPSALPDLDAWQRSLGVALRLAPPSNWRMVPTPTAGRIDQERQHWRPSAAVLMRWRQVGWILLAALMLHSTALLVDRVRLAGEQHQLRQTMETRFRALFPGTVAVADPMLQTRRLLAQTRHLANQPDPGDFPVMLNKLVPALAGVPAAELHALSYEEGRMTLEFTAPGEPLARQIHTRLVQAGFDVQPSAGARSAVRGTLTLTLGAP